MKLFFLSRTTFPMFISRHSGVGNTDIPAYKIYYDRHKYGEQFIPIGEFLYDKDVKLYYVRLTDGFEYRRR